MDNKEKVMNHLKSIEHTLKVESKKAANELAEEGKKYIQYNAPRYTGALIEAVKIDFNKKNETWLIQNQPHQETTSVYDEAKWKANKWKIDEPYHMWMYYKTNPVKITSGDEGYWSNMVGFLFSEVDRKGKQILRNSVK